ncbi:FadD3 family acyl-CoA ligase [Rhodococcus sp. 077-4]|uniref:FadD3 family acyl-CoA ligase n=1 Tax=Rhodococcus sp. 077-4 TaxID=2789271 RepID=UPI0039F5B2F2
MNGEHFTTTAALDDAAVRFGDDIAVVDGDVRLTFAELRTAAWTVGRALMTLGVEPDDRVALWIPNTHHWVVGALAAHVAGGQLVPVNTRYTAGEAADLLARTRARVLFVPELFLGNDRLTDLTECDLPDLRAVVSVDIEGRRTARPRGPWDVEVFWNDLSTLAKETAEETKRHMSGSVTADHVSDILFTSGTTGRSKGAMSSHRQALAVARSWAECTGLRRGDRYLVVNPFFHSFGYKAGLLASLLVGATIYPMAVYDPAGALTAIARHAITVLPGAPTIYRTIIDHPERNEHDLSSLRLAVTGAAAVPKSLLRDMRRYLNIETILTAYGLTEAVVATMCRPGDDDDTVSTTSGRAAAEFEVRIDDTGEILLRGPNVMLGYLDDPDASSVAIDADGWLHTGDIGRLDDRGYLTVTDRLKDMYIAGGFNVYPAEVEQAIIGFEGVADAAVFGIPDARLGEAGLAVVVPARNGGALNIDALLAHCRHHLANFKIPKKFELRQSLPRNAGGKVLKDVLREEFR